MTFGEWSGFVCSISRNSEPAVILNVQLDACVQVSLQVIIIMGVSHTGLGTQGHSQKDSAQKYESGCSVIGIVELDTSYQVYYSLHTQSILYYPVSNVLPSLHSITYPINTYPIQPILPSLHYTLYIYTIHQSQFILHITVSLYDTPSTVYSTQPAVLDYPL